MTALVTEHPGLAVPVLADDFDEHYEIVDGQRVELPPMSAKASRIASRLVTKLNDFAGAHNWGEAVVETLFRLALPVARNRRPDVALVSFARWPKSRPLPNADNAWDVVPDLAAEVISPNDMAEELLEKIAEYFSAGVQQVWVVYPLRRVVYVYEAECRIQVFTSTDELGGGTVLPGFKLPLTALFGEEPAAPEDRPS
jgi:Uma2 family endonuclease